MVEAVKATSQYQPKSKEASPASLVWSLNDDIHKMAVQPVKALINLVGSRETTHSTLKEIINTGMRDIITKQGNVTSNYAPPSVRIQSYDLPSVCPRQAKRRQANSTPSNELGYLKRNFFSSLGYNKPAVTIFVFDWRDWAKYVPSGEQFDWKEHENLVLGQIQQHSQKWLTDLSVPSKYMIIILFPQPQPGKENTLNIDQCMTSFRRAVQLSGDENIKSSNYFLSNGFEALKTGLMKKFVKNVHELVVSYYREKKNNIKRKQKKLISGQLQHIRYGMNSALYSLITSNDFAKSIEKLDAAYQQLKSIQIGSQSKTNDEKRDNADILAMTILSLFLQSNQLQKIVEFFRTHFRFFQKDMSNLKPEARLEEMKWRSMWFFTMGQLLERFYKQQGGLQLHTRLPWHSQTSLDFFPGQYFLNCMLQLIARQQELGKLRVDCLATGRQLYDNAVLETVVRSSSTFIGKEYEMIDASQGGKPVRSGDRYEDSLLQFRVYEESLVSLGLHILTAGQIAIGYFKQRSQLLRGPTGQLYTRTVHLINYHLSELLDRQHLDEEDSEVIQSEVKPFVSMNEKQKIRRTIQSQLIKEKWTKEAVSLIETSKTHSTSLEEYFQNEMKILLNAHNLQNHKRHQRLMELIEKVQGERLIDKEPIKLTGIVQGTALLWARARFEHDKIQINKFNKLTLEVFSRLSQPIKIAKLNIMMSQVDLSQEIDFAADDTLSENYYVLSKSNPIRLERQFYLNQEDDQIGQIMLNQIMLEVAAKKTQFMDTEEPTAPPQNKLFFSISPYLAPETNLLDLNSNSSKRQLKRLPPPIMYSIEPLPHKIKIDAIQSDAKDQALLGDPYDIKLKLSVLENVKMRSLKAVFLKFETSQLGDEAVEDILPKRSATVNMDQTQDGMVDVDLTYSIHSGIPLSSQDSQSNFSRLSASMFSPNMSQFYQNARSVLSTSSVNPLTDSSQFLGADPSIGVAVLKRSLTNARRPKAEILQSDDLLGQVNEMDEETDFQSVELFYTKGQNSSEEDLQNIILDTEEPSEDKVVSLLNDKGEIDELNLKMIFYQEGKMNNLTVRFQYEFTQNQGLDEETTHLKAFDYNIKVRAQSPFKVDWHVKSSDCFLSSLQHFFSLHLGAQEQLRRLLNQISRQSIFDQSNSLPIKEEIAALTGCMVAPEEQTCWLVCKLTSQAKHRDITIKDLRLQLNPEIADFVEIIDSIGCNTDGSDDIEDDILSIEPGETYEVLFKLRVDKVKIARSFIGDLIEGMNLSGLPQSKPTSDGAREGEVTIIDQVNTLKKLYQLQQVELFSELHFNWSSFQEQESASNLIELDDGEQARKTGDYIPCCVGSPPINFVTRPLQVRIKNEREIEQIRIHQPFTVEYEITNLTNKVILALVELQTPNDGPTKAPFMIAGEIKSRLTLMPTDEGYSLRYTFFPQMLGSHALPRFSIYDQQMRSVHLIKDYTIKVHVVSA